LLPSNSLSQEEKKRENQLNNKNEYLKVIIKISRLKPQTAQGNNRNSLENCELNSRRVE